MTNSAINRTAWKRGSGSIFLVFGVVALVGGVLSSDSMVLWTGGLLVLAGVVQIGRWAAAGDGGDGADERRGGDSDGPNPPIR